MGMDVHKRTTRSPALKSFLRLESCIPAQETETHILRVNVAGSWVAASLPHLSARKPQRPHRGTDGIGEQDGRGGCSELT